MSTDKVTYSFVKDEGNLFFRSKVNSFNLDHITDKNIVSFYQNFSHYASLDTGLLPVDGTGLLAIRSAGNHTQVAYQYKPGMYYVNWGAHEGDNNAVSYLVAQPYRIVIIDFVDNNLLGARTFYSPIPATHPGIQLYHVNLPNINCKGYRGNGVGWICLYHNQDWSTMPFNERLARALERCSGIEVYNDANMSETDGPRFYASKSKPSYITNPREWEEKSQAEGFEWTIDENLWIPITVKDRDEQGQHYEGEGAIPLTLGDAIVGKYNAYYNDGYHPKPINALTNPNLQLDASEVTNWFIKAYNSSTTDFVGIDPFLQSQQTRQKIAETQLHKQSLLTSNETPNNQDEDDDEEGVMCTACESYYSEDDSYSQNDEWWCTDCFNDNFTICVNTEEYLHNDDDQLFYDEGTEEYYDLSAVKGHEVCINCSSLHFIDHSSYTLHHSSTAHWQPNIWHHVNIEHSLLSTITCCSKCIDSLDGIDVDSCSICGTDVPSLHNNPSALIIPKIDSDNSKIHQESNKAICNLCASKTYTQIKSYDNKSYYSFELLELAFPKTYIISENNYKEAYVTVTDFMKQNDMHIHDEYLMQITFAPLSDVDIKPTSAITSHPDNLDDDPDTLYRVLKETATLSIEQTMKSHLFQNVLTNCPYVTLIPYNNPF
jgi:hypothetical protein